MVWPFARTADEALVVEKLANDHLRAVADIHAQTFSRPWTDGEIEDLMHTHSNWAFVARSADRPERVAGFTMLRTAVDEAEILTIAVKPSWQRHGVGRMLMDSALQRAYTERFASIYLEVGETNRAARALYTKLGFISVGERPNYYQHADGTRGNAIVMRRDFAKR